MCQLFGICSSEEYQINDYLKEFFSHSNAHPHGWGMAFMEIIFSKREYQEKPDLQGLQKLWNVVKCVGNYIVCNTYAAGMQQIFQ